MGDITYSIDEFVAAAKSLFGNQSGPDIVRAALSQAGKGRYAKDDAAKIIKEFSEKPISGQPKKVLIAKPVVPAKQAVSVQHSPDFSSSGSTITSSDKGVK